jgi:hypothetical protein
MNQLEKFSSLFVQYSSGSVHDLNFLYQQNLSISRSYNYLIEFQYLRGTYLYLSELFSRNASIKISSRFRNYLSFRKLINC